MAYLLDTGILIELEHKNKRFADNLNKLVKDFAQLNITLFNFAEFYYGYLLKNAKTKREAENFLDIFNHLTLTKASAKRYSELDCKYSKQGVGFEPFDLLMAAIAIEEKMTLLTTDSDFARIAELKKEILSPT